MSDSLNFTPDTTGAWLIVATASGTGIGVGTRRDFKVLGWTRQGAHIVPVVCDEMSARTYTVDWETLDSGYFAFAPQVVRVDTDPDDPDGETFTREPHWGTDFAGIERDVATVAARPTPLTNPHTNNQKDPK